MNTYQDNVEKYHTALLTLKKDLNRLSVLRLVTFVASVTIITVLANERLGSLLFVVVPLCVFCFGFLVKRYNQVADLEQHTASLKEINEQEILKLKNKLSGLPTGQGFLDRDHPYAGDLDIFGAQSLFQLLNRTTTESGNVRLAAWLSEPASKEIILATTSY